MIIKLFLIGLITKIVEQNCAFIQIVLYKQWIICMRECFLQAVSLNIKSKVVM